jgi:hypothetical protein
MLKVLHKVTLFVTFCKRLILKTRIMRHGRGGACLVATARVTALSTPVRTKKASASEGLVVFFVEGDLELGGVVFGVEVAGVEGRL